MANNRHKILYLITKGNFGGAQRYVFDLASSLPKESFDVVVAFGQAGALSEKLKEFDIRTIEIKSLGRDINPLLDLKAFFELIKIIKKEKPDTIHVNSSKIGGIGSLVGRLMKTKNIIFTVHGWAWNEDRDLFSKMFIKFLQWLTIIFTHKTIIVSKSSAKQIAHWPFIFKKIHTIHNGISPFPTQEPDEARKNIYPDFQKNIWIGTTSELHKNKGLDYLIDAFSKIIKNKPECRLVILGEGEERPKLEKLIADKNLSGKVFMAGYIKDAKKYLKAFHIFTLTSRTEAFPYSILEAGLSGSAVLASAVGGIPEIIENKISGILTRPGNIDEIERGINHLLENENARNTYAKNIKEKIEMDFSQEKMVTKTIALYN
jgi:glycosyltransferase involved in cell wall biosynthesis